MTSPGIPPSAGRSVDLIASIRAGDPEALASAYYTYAASLLALAHRLLGNRSDAQDLIQDFFVGLPEALAHYEERGQISAWLARALVRLALMRQRSTRRRRETNLVPAGPAPTTGPSDPASELDRALGELADDERAIVVLKAIEGYSHDEIAELFGIRASASAVRYHRALKRLRAHLEQP